jgi:hypothetical protein
MLSNKKSKSLTRKNLVAVLAAMGLSAHKVQLGPRVQKVHRVHKVLQVPKVKQVQKAHRGLKESLAYRANREYRANKVQSVLKALRGQRDPKVK